MWVAVLVVAGALVAESHKNGRYPSGSRVLRALSKADQQAGCLYEGRWYVAGSAVRTREACLSCACAHGALSCARRTCVPLPEPPPRCHVLHRKGDCCPELRCPDGVKHQHEASARLDDTDIDRPTSLGHVFPACVEGGTVYAAGSAMSSGTPCEQCFCLGGARRCVRPRCLPPPPGCQARPTSGACCPQRYYCEHISKPVDEKNSHDCVTPEGSWASEGERVKTAETGLSCIQCFCLRGSIRCQHLSCAPSLQGCTPLVQPGQCCPHQYQCDRHANGTKLSLHSQRQNILMSLRDEDRSFHTSKSTKRDTTAKEQTTVTDKSTVAVTVTKKDLTTTAKVKRETEVPNITSSSVRTEKSETSTSSIAQTTQKLNEATQTLATETTTLDETSEELPMEQPPGSVKVIINGTINCTTELSSTSLLLNVSDTNDTVWIDSQTQPRIPIINTIDIEAHTFPPNDIITEGSYKEEYDDNETFTINVTSSLRTNTSHSTTTTVKPSPVVPKTVPPALLGKVNVSKTKKEEYDYDYTEPTLPPSLPNLKIIPFVAADAVVEDDVSSKESLDYPTIEREDNFPVYYPSKETKDTIYATRKVDVYNPTQYPIFISKKVEPHYPSLTQEADNTNVPFPSIRNEMPVPVQEYTVTASLGSSAKINYKGDNPPTAPNTQFEVEPPAINLFSPPIETEGGFVPKGPGIVDDYYSVYSSTPSGNIMSHLTTSMQLEPKDECVSGDGRHVSEGESISLSCSICTCAWGELHCSPLPCNTPPGCRRNAANISTTDLCCGELICDKLKNTTSMPLMTTNDIAINPNETEIASKYEKVSFTYHDSTTTPRVYTNIDTVKDTSLGTNISETNERFENMTPITSVTSSTTEKSVSYTTTTQTADNAVVENNNQSLEYDEEDDDDEGFSLGNVLKLLLSETYDTTTVSPKKKMTTVIPSTMPKMTSTSVPTTKRKQFTSSENGFVPVTHRSPYVPPKKLYSPNTINRIDHLVLGESNAIRKSTPKPVTQTTTRKVVTSAKTTPQPITTKTVEISSKEGFGGHPVEVRPPSPNFVSGYGLGLPKLAGCNIYGRMYRVGRIIAELSSPCQECKCTELGVQCRSLSC
ncbi:mucin-5AC-like [Maniola jurtina]|uniref:mucin-5AC-like n=1 Tax=Maniola jurtina TaxID=191418 RepID=UPI001E68BCCD|nr:mucin-5AC-like [Maniola jurtina]